MSSNITKSVFTLILFIVFVSFTNAQPKKGEFINASIGIGLTSPYEDIDVGGQGFYAQAEYLWGLKTWFGLRPYAGFVFTSKDKDVEESLREFKVTTNAFLFGVKARIAIPIPFIAPYFETGIGGSIGAFETYTPLVNKKENGLLMHIPFTVGLVIGKNHGVDLAFVYYFHDSVDQVAGAVAVGLSFPINK